jgi:hypothetical protein
MTCVLKLPPACPVWFSCKCATHAAAAAIVVALAVTTITPLHAQIASAPPTARPSGWSFAVTPYAWLPTISSTFDATGPRGRTVSTSIDAGIGDYLSDINFAAMVGAAARYDRFSVMTAFGRGSESAVFGLHGRAKPAGL